MTIEATNPVIAALPPGFAPESQAVTFNEVVARVAAEQANLGNTGFQNPGSDTSPLSALRPMLEGLLANENSMAIRGARIDQPTRNIAGLTEGNGLPQAFGKDDTGKALEKLESSMTNMIDVSTYLIRMQIVNKSVQGFQRVLDQLGRGQ
jgi:hypothetical protein